MNVECVFFGPPREAVGQKTVVRETDARIVGELLAELEAAYPGLAVLDGRRLREDVVVTLDQRHVQHIDGLSTELSEGAVLRVTTAVYGGSARSAVSPQ